MKSGIKFDSEEIIKKFKKHKLINNIEFFGNEIFVSSWNIDIDLLAEVMWNKIHHTKELSQPTQKLDFTSSNIQNNFKKPENVVNISNNVSDIDKQLELLKKQQEILDRQIELEKLKQQNKNI